MTQHALKTRPHTTLQSKTPLSNIYVIASGKGGVGKTCCSITLASLLSKSGKKTLLFDGDIGLANIDIQLGLNPEYDLCDLLSQKCDLKSVITHYTDESETQKIQLDILPGRSGSGMLGNLSPQQYSILFSSFKTLSSEYDIILIDLGAGVDHAMRNLAKIGQNQLVVVTTEATSLTDAYAYIKVMHHINSQFKFQILVNRAPNEKAGTQTFNTLQKVCETYLSLDIFLAGIIEEDQNFSQSIRLQKSMPLAFPHSKSIKQLNKIQRNIFE